MKHDYNLSRSEYGNENEKVKQAKKERMKHRKNQKKCLLYPEHNLKEIWDLIMLLFLMVACIFTPLDIAFTTSHSEFL